MRSLFLVASALALTLIGPACSPNAPTDGFFGCATGACPASFPYCDPVELRCYASAPTDAGPRPDSPRPDAPAAAGEYQPCGSPPSCGTLSCISGSCMTPCTGGTCGDGRLCRPASTMDMTTACIVSCDGGGSCPMNTRPRTVMAGQCQCVPFSWPM